MHISGINSQSNVILPFMMKSSNLYLWWILAPASKKTMKHFIIVFADINLWIVSQAIKKQTLIKNNTNYIIWGNTYQRFETKILTTASSSGLENGSCSYRATSPQRPGVFNIQNLSFLGFRFQWSLTVISIISCHCAGKSIACE